MQSYSIRCAALFLGSLAAFQACSAANAPSDEVYLPILKVGSSWDIKDFIECKTSGRLTTRDLKTGASQQEVVVDAKERWTRTSRSLSLSQLVAGATQGIVVFGSTKWGENAPDASPMFSLPTEGKTYAFSISDSAASVSPLQDPNPVTQTTLDSDRVVALLRRSGTPVAARTASGWSLFSESWAALVGNYLRNVELKSCREVARTPGELILDCTGTDGSDTTYNYTSHMKLTLNATSNEVLAVIADFVGTKSNARQAPLADKSFETIEIRKCMVSMEQSASK